MTLLGLTTVELYLIREQVYIFSRNDIAEHVSRVFTMNRIISKSIHPPYIFAVLGLQIV
jgi:hypothetical protein